MILLEEAEDWSLRNARLDFTDPSADSLLALFRAAPSHKEAALSGAEGMI